MNIYNGACQLELLLWFWKIAEYVGPHIKSDPRLTPHLDNPFENVCVYSLASE